MNLSKIIPIRYNLGNLSQYRTPLMGMSIIMILLCHARMDGAQLPDVVLSILSLGNWGVDIFLLVSGIGMYYSISKKGNNINWEGWILSRLKRVLIPYLILESPFWIWYSLHDGTGIKGFFYCISFCSYWTEHVGLWFLALLIPLYIITPLLYKLLSSSYKYLNLGILLVIVMVISVYPVGDNTIINTIQSCLFRTPCYLIGLCIGSEVKESKRSCLIYLIPIILYIILQTFDSFSAVYKGWIWALLIAVLFAQLFSYMSRSRLYNVITLLNIGKYTLELYIGLDISKNILIQFMGLGTSYWLLSICGSIVFAFLYNVVFLKIFSKGLKWS